MHVFEHVLIPLNKNDAHDSHFCHFFQCSPDDPGLPKPLPPPTKDTCMETDQQEPSLDKNELTSSAKPSKKPDDVNLNLSGMSDVSLSSSPGGDDTRHGPKTPPTRGPDSLNVSDISSDFDNDQQPGEAHEDAPVNQAEKIGKEEAVVVQEVESAIAPPTDKPEGTTSEEDIPGNQAVVVKETESEEVAADEEMKSAECAETVTSDATTESTALLPAEDVPHPLLVEPLSSQGSAPPSPSAVGTPIKTPGKRKVAVECTYTLWHKLWVVRTVTLYQKINGTCRN